jgi:DMSO/TMAO reductase YedYZ heme-binding membrane subunit
MVDERAQKKANWLWRIWLVTYIIYASMTGVYNFITTIETGVSPVTMLSHFQIITLVITSMFFLPLILMVHHYAQQAKMTKILVCARVLSIIISIWTTMSIIFTIYCAISG